MSEEKEGKNLTLYILDRSLLAKGKEIAERLAISYIVGELPLDSKGKVKLEKEELVLVLSEDGLSLTDGINTMRGDFSEKLSRLKPNNLNGEMLVKATKIKGASFPMTLIDATAGMGEDSLILAAAGFEVKLFEYNSVIAELLKDTLERAKKVPELSAIVARMEYIGGDSIEAMNNLTFTPDIILLDPMFPERQKSSLVKKKFQLLQKLEQPCSDERAMMEAALKVNPRRIVIKRMLKNPYLGDIKPDYSIEGKAIRYDCIVQKS